MASAAKRLRTVPSAGYKMADRDGGFCSAEDEEDLDIDMHSPTDVSEDSVDVKVKPIANLMGGCKSKRKCAEPRKFGEEVKKRLVEYQGVSEVDYGPFRPWSQQPLSGTIPRVFAPARRDQQEEPLSLVLRDESSKVLDRLEPVPVKEERLVSNVRKEHVLHNLGGVTPTEGLEQLTSSVSSRVVIHTKSRPRPQEVVRLRETTPTSMKLEDLGEFTARVGSHDTEDSIDRTRMFSVESLIRPSDRPSTSSSNPSSSITGDKRKPLLSQAQQRNYKNMTRERRIEANARERTRVHTISAAFDTLRRAVPAYSHNQKLSKLSVLRIACSYILTLSRVAGNDYSADGSQPSLSDCVDNVSRTIQLEGKLRKKKDD